MSMPEIRGVKLPFNLHDVFAFLLPGLTLAALLLVPLEWLKETNLRSLWVTQPAHLAWLLTLALLVAGYVLGHVIGVLAGLPVEKAIVGRWMKYPTHNMLFRKEGILHLRFFRRPYGAAFALSFWEAFKTTFGIARTEAEEDDVFWLTFQYVTCNCPPASARATYFLSLAHFSRNLALAFGVGAVFAFSLPFWTPASRWIWVWYALPCAIVASCFLWKYLMLFRQFTDEIFRAFYAHHVTTRSGPLRSGNKVGPGAAQEAALSAPLESVAGLTPLLWTG
jgi:hypothetical protein